MRKYRLVYIEGTMTMTNIFWEYPSEVSSTVMIKLFSNWDNFISLEHLVEAEPHNITEEPHPNV